MSGSRRDFRLLPSLVRRRIEDLTGSGDHIFIVACSGGLDSVVLADAVVRSGLESVLLAHVDHGLRELPERQEDWAVLQGVSRRLNVPLERRVIDEGVLERDRSGQGLEERARSHRYRLLADIAYHAGLAANKVPLLLTAHHERDQSETVLMRFLSGRSPLEATTIPEVRILPGREVTVIRPLLKVPADLLQEYAEAHKLEWHRDTTNDDIRYTRNYIRRILMGEITARFPGAPASMAQFGYDVDLLTEGLRRLIPPSSWGTFGGDGTWRTRMTDLENLPVAAREMVVRKALHGVTEEQRVSFGPFRDFLGRIIQERDHSRPPASVTARDVRMSLKGDILELRRDIVPILESRYLWVMDVGSPFVSPSGVTVALNSVGSGNGTCWWPVAPPVLLHNAGDDTIIMEDTRGEIATIEPDRTYTLRDGVAATPYPALNTPYVSVQFDN
jgi:tRNA(Ile)-lysidine synthetase-like protein